MTIEEKARAYDEALERARMINSGEDVDIEAGTTICEYIFPELKELKNENIIKNIIRLLKGEISYTSKEENEKYIAWLEKQDKMEVDARYDNLKALLEADDIYQMSMNDAMVNEAKTKAVKALSELAISKLLNLKKEDEQKFDWSEDDDAYKLFTISAVEDYYDGKNPLRKDLVDWLKSLKQRIGG